MAALPVTDTSKRFPGDRNHEQARKDSSSGSPWPLVLVLGAGAGPVAAPASCPLPPATAAAGRHHRHGGRRPPSRRRQGQGRQGDRSQPVPVELAGSRAGASPPIYRAASVIEADRLVDLVARTSGRVRAIDVEEGDWVEQGAGPGRAGERPRTDPAAQGRADPGRQEAPAGAQPRDAGRRADQPAGIRRPWNRPRDLAEAERDLAADRPGGDPHPGPLRRPHHRPPHRRRASRSAAGTPAFTLGDFSPLRVRVHLPEAVARKVDGRPAGAGRARGRRRGSSRPWSSASRRWSIRPPAPCA